MNMLTGKNSIKRTISSIVFAAALMMAGTLFSQEVAIYKISDLLKRIHHNSDTVYVVNFWATWCKPCVAELPEFEQFGIEQKANKIKVLLVSMDFKEDIQAKLIPFLKKNHYTSEVVLLDELNGNSFINQVSKEWTGAIPATLITGSNHQPLFFEKKMTKESLAAGVAAVSKH